MGRPKSKLLSESLRLLPDLLRLLRRLAADRSEPAGVRIQLGLGSAKQTAMPVAAVSWACWASSVPRSQVSDRRSGSGMPAMAVAIASLTASAP
jgi:hypothetical protein